MPEEGFLRRWARVKASGGEATAEAPSRPAAAVPAAPSVTTPSPAAPASRAGTPAATSAGAAAGGATPAAAQDGAAPARPLPTLEDVARLTSDSDFSAFVTPGVDKSVQRLALKKLFADPHFNVLDRLDMYMDDYNKPSPVSAAMLASFDHARSALRRMVEDEPTPDARVAAGAKQEDTEGETARPGETALDNAACEPTEAGAAPAAPLPHEEGGQQPAREQVHQQVPPNEAAHAGVAHEPSLHGEAT
ncbi:MAG: hypothetical protein V7631_4359 [Massilia sp.]